MSLWQCPTHGLTGPRQCCPSAARVEVGEPVPRLTPAQQQDHTSAMQERGHQMAEREAGARQRSHAVLTMEQLEQLAETYQPHDGHDLAPLFEAGLIATIAAGELALDEGTTYEQFNARVAAAFTGATPTGCGCVNVDFGTYKNVVILWPPPSFELTRIPLGIDRCIALEILDLWHAGIRTVASCCGHNKQPAIISVAVQHEAEMGARGYVRQPTGSGEGTHYVTYRAKSVPARQHDAGVQFPGPSSTAHAEALIQQMERYPRSGASQVAAAKLRQHIAGLEQEILHLGERVLQEDADSRRIRDAANVNARELAAAKAQLEELRAAVLAKPLEPTFSEADTEETRAAKWEAFHRAYVEWGYDMGELRETLTAQDRQSGV